MVIFYKPHIVEREVPKLFLTASREVSQHFVMILREVMVEREAQHFVLVQMEFIC